MVRMGGQRERDQRRGVTFEIELPLASSAI
jgi:hypothetical protein